MPIELRFFDWSEPALPAAARWLADKFARAASLDLSDVIVCVAGGQVRRRLLELLVEVAEDRELFLSPPHIVTPGHLPELLYEAKQPFASELTQRLVWVKVLASMESAQLAPLVRNPPDKNDLAAWLALAQTLAELHRELASDGLDCEAVLAEAVHCDGFNENARWKLLAKLERQYLRLLDGLKVWDKQTARLFAIKHCECRTDRRIVLVGLVDLNRAQRQMLDAVAERVTALVFAPREGLPAMSDGGGAKPKAGSRVETRSKDFRQSSLFPWEDDEELPGGAATRAKGSSGPNPTMLARLFDEHGCLRPDGWQSVCLPLSEKQIEIVDSAADQGDAVVRWLAGLDGRYAAEEIVIGIPDSRLAPFIRQRLEESSLPARQLDAIPLSRTAAGQLLGELADYLEQRRFSDLAALVRHPSLAHRISAMIDGDWLTLVDEFYCQYLPAKAADKWPRGRYAAEFRRVQGTLDGLLAKFDRAERPLGQWAEPIVELLREVYGQEELDEAVEPDRTIIRACGQIRDTLKTFLDLAASVSPAVTAAAAIRLLLRELEAEKITPRADGEAIELLGWLELIWNDAPAMIVTGFNEGAIASPVGRDLFLPNALRQRLPLEDNERRLARDSYALGLLAASRRDLHIVAGRRSPENEPLVPSRLLFCCRDGDLPARAMRLFTPANESSRRVLLPGSLRPAVNSGLQVPRPDPLAEPINEFRVTEFKDYLACPYRYYLRHRLGLDALSDAAEELDPGQFGSLLHEALQGFGTSAAKDSDDADEIRDCLFTLLGELAARQYAEGSQPAVPVQIELAKLRLAEFAKKQARRRSDGWRIKHVEIKFGQSDDSRPAGEMVVDGTPAALIGRIDRIDEHESSGRWAVLDYKTSEKAEPPRKAHNNADGWTDLQLPLYRHLIQSLDDCPAADHIELGYVHLPKGLKQVNFTMADWTAAELAAADAAAAAVVRGIRKGDFWPRTVPAPPFNEQFAAICQDELLGAAAVEEETEEVEE